MLVAPSEIVQQVHTTDDELILTRHGVTSRDHVGTRMDDK